MSKVPGQRTPLQRHLSDARQRLIQTGTRNRLIHAARFSKQSKAIDIVDERSEDVFRILLKENRRMRFAHDPSVRETKDDSEPVLISLSNAADEGRYTDLLLQTRFGQDRLLKKLLGMAREARTLEEEQGINALYLAVGFYAGMRMINRTSSEMRRSFSCRFPYAVMNELLLTTLRFEAKTSPPTSP